MDDPMAPPDYRALFEAAEQAREMHLAAVDAYETYRRELQLNGAGLDEVPMLSADQAREPSLGASA
jgi:hypothetical protein